MNGSTIKHVTKEMLKEFKTPISTNKQFLKNLEPKINSIETLQTESKESDTEYLELIKELNIDIIKNYLSIIIH